MTGKVKTQAERTRLMSSKLKSLGLPLVTIAALIIMVVWMSGTFDSRIEPAITPSINPEPDNLYLVKNKLVNIIEPVAASVEAREATSISSRVLARITQFHVRAGDFVSKGQLLIELEKKDLESIAQQSRENIRAINARLTESKNTLTRINNLFEQGIVPVADLDKANANQQSLSAELDSAKQALGQAETAITYTEIRSPIDGRIVDRFAEPGDTATPGAHLLSLYNPLSLRIEAQVREHLALTLSIGQSVTVEIPSLQKTLQATFEEKVPAAEPGSRSFLIKARVQLDGSLLPGMYARLLVSAGQENRLYIPTAYLAEVGQLNLVWVWQDKQVYRRYVKVGRINQEGMIHIISGLKDGDQILAPPST